MPYYKKPYSYLRQSTGTYRGIVFNVKVDDKKEIHKWYRTNRISIIKIDMMETTVLHVLYSLLVPYKP